MFLALTKQTMLLFSVAAFIVLHVGINGVISMGEGDFSSSGEHNPFEDIKIVPAVEKFVSAYDQHFHETRPLDLTDEQIIAFAKEHRFPKKACSELIEKYLATLRHVDGDDDDDSAPKPESEYLKSPEYNRTSHAADTCLFYRSGFELAGDVARFDALHKSIKEVVPSSSDDSTPSKDLEIAAPVQKFVSAYEQYFGETTSPMDLTYDQMAAFVKDHPFPEEACNQLSSKYWKLSDEDDDEEDEESMKMEVDEPMKMEVDEPNYRKSPEYKRFLRAVHICMNSRSKLEESALDESN